MLRAVDRQAWTAHRCAKGGKSAMWSCTPMAYSPIPDRGTQARSRCSRSTGQVNNSWMSAAVIAPDSKSPESMTLATRAPFFALRAMTFSSKVSLATKR